MKQSTSPKLGYSDLIVTRVHHSPMIGIPKRQLVSKKDSEPVLRSVPSETTRRLPFPLPVPFSFFFSSFYQRSVAGVHLHSRALTFGRTLIDRGIYFFSYLSSLPLLSASITRRLFRFSCFNPSIRTTVVVLPSLVFSFSNAPFLSGTTSHPATITDPALYPESPRARSVSHSHFVSHSPMTVQIGEIKLHNDAAAVIRRLHFSIIGTRLHCSRFERRASRE